MASIHIGNQKVKLYIGGTKVKKGYLGNTKVYSSGNIVTYHVTQNLSYQEEVDSDASCLSPTTFSPDLEGYAFTGWRMDQSANGTVLTSKIMGDDPIDLYAVFHRTVTVTLYNNSTTASKLTGTYYYNNGNYTAPIFTQAAADKGDDWEFQGWSESAEVNGTIKYSLLNSQSIGDSCTLYGIYHKDIIITLYNNSTASTILKGIAAYNSSDKIAYPTFTQAAHTKNDWTFRGWSFSAESDAGISYNSIDNTAFTANTTLYAAYYRDVYFYYGIDEDNYKENNYNTPGICYYNSSGNLKPATFTVPENPFENGNNKFLHWEAIEGGVKYKPNDSLTMDGSTLVYTIVGVWEYVKPYTFFFNKSFYDKDGKIIKLNRWLQHGNLGLHQYRCEETGEVLTESELDKHKEPYTKVSYPNGGGDYEFKYNSNLDLAAWRTMVNYAMIEVGFYNVNSGGCKRIKFQLGDLPSTSAESIDFMGIPIPKGNGYYVERDYAHPIRFGISDSSYQGARLSVSKIEFIE